MSDVKRCVQCGLLKEAIAFRPYTYSRRKNTTGRYRICRECEALNARYTKARQYIEETQNARENPELYLRSLSIIQKTEQLYSLLKSKGLRVPGTQPVTSMQSVDKLLEFYGAETAVVNTVSTEVITEGLPDELKSWLDSDPATWHEHEVSPEYLQETVYESLKAKYRPQTGIDRETYLPIYDDTYKDVLNKILRKFDDYEEEYVEAEEEDETNE